MESQTSHVELTGYRNRESMERVTCEITQAAQSLESEKCDGAENLAFDDNETNVDLKCSTSECHDGAAHRDPEKRQETNANTSGYTEHTTSADPDCRPDRNYQSGKCRQNVCCTSPDDISDATKSKENAYSGGAENTDTRRDTQHGSRGADNTAFQNSEPRHGERCECDTPHGERCECDTPHGERCECDTNPQTDDFEDAGGGLHVTTDQDGDSPAGCTNHDASRSSSVAEDKPSRRGAPDSTEKKTKNVQKWIVLAAAFSCRILGEGYANSMGIFFLEFLEYFDSGRGVTGWTVSIATGIMYGAGIPISFLVHKTNERGCCIAGGLIAGSGLIASYFAPNVYVLLGTFGVMTGIGLAFIQISYVIAVGRHFREGRGPATAICETGVTVGGIAFPPLLRFLMDNYEWRGALLISGGLLLNIVAFGILFSPPSMTKPNNLTRERDEDIVPTNLNDPVKYCNSDIKRVKPFVVYVIVGMFVGLSCFFPYGTIVDVANTRGYERQKGTYLVMALSVANTVGVFIMAGLLKLFWRHVTLLYTLNICLLGASVYIFPLTGTYETLLLATVLYGLPCGGLYGSYAVVVVDLLGEKLYTPGLGFACTGYGIGYALSTPVAGWITEATGDYEKPFYIGGSVCLGAAILFGAALVVDRCQKRVANRRPLQSASSDAPGPATYVV